MVWSGALLTCCLPYDTHDLTAQDPEAAVRTLSPLTSTGRRATRALLSAPACEYDRLWRGAALHTTAISIRALARTDENIAGLGLHEYVVLGDERVRNFADEARDPEEDPNEDYDPDQEEDDDAGPEDPLVLLGAALDHAYGVAADAERVGDAVHLLLGVLEHVALGAQVSEHGLASVSSQLFFFAPKSACLVSP